MGREVGRLLVHKITVFGIDINVWIPLLVAGLSLWFLSLWMTRERG
jgi:hypothetical protein